LLPMGGVIVQRHWCCTAVRRRSPLHFRPAILAPAGAC
jgi:hypothetical protein